MLKTTHVICPICEKKLIRISSRHLKIHNISLKEFKLQYPNNEINSDVYKEYQKKYRKKNNFRNYNKIWRENNLNYNKIWRENNKDKYKQYDIDNAERRHARRKIDYQKRPHIYAWRNLLGNSLRRLGKSKEGKTIKLLGYSSLDLKEHIQNLFTDGMSWENYGEWHIDHIKEIYTFDKNTPLNIVNALSNLRPLWATTREINGIIYEGNLNRKKYYKLT